MAPIEVGDLNKAVKGGRHRRISHRRRQSSKKPSEGGVEQESDGEEDLSIILSRDGLGSDDPAVVLESAQALQVASFFV